MLLELQCRQFSPWRRNDPITSGVKRSASATPAARNRLAGGAQATAASAARPPAHQGPHPPLCVEQSHAVRVGGDLGTDWVLAGDWSEERRLREARNVQIEAMLKEGKTVACRSSGWSLWPRVQCGGRC